MNTPFTIPLDVPHSKTDLFIKNYTALLRSTNRLLLLACDHPLEHLEAVDFQTLFSLARSNNNLPVAAHWEAIMRYAGTNQENQFIVKVNGKTNLVSSELQDPISSMLTSIDTIISTQNERNLLIRGVGYTLYPGSMYEHSMLSQASQVITQAHTNGLVAILWAYPRGKSIPDDRDPDLLRGVVAMANDLGADFVKIKIPHYANYQELTKSITAIAHAAGNTRVVFSGGEIKNSDQLLQEIDAINAGYPTTGLAIGRNIFQRAHTQADQLLQAISHRILQ